MREIFCVYNTHLLRYTNYQKFNWCTVVVKTVVIVIIITPVTVVVSAAVVATVAAVVVVSSSSGTGSGSSSRSRSSSSSGERSVTLDAPIFTLSSPKKAIHPLRSSGKYLDDT
jgi:uncharacterized membrane protein YgcG